MLIVGLQRGRIDALLAQHDGCVEQPVARGDDADVGAAEPFARAILDRTHRLLAGRVGVGDAEDAAERTAFLLRGAIQHQLGNFQSALADVTQAIALDPGFALAYQERSIIYTKLNQPDLAAQDLARAGKRVALLDVFKMK